MSDIIDDLDDENDAGGAETDTGPKALRAELKKLKARQTALETENAGLKKDQRSRAVGELLEKHGASPRLAKYYDRTEASDDDVQAWLKENGEDFGWNPDGSDETDQDTVDEAARIGRATISAPPKAVSRQITAEFLKTAPYEDLQKLGLVR